MKPDFLFVSAGALALCAALLAGLAGQRAAPPARRLVGGLLWAVLGAGLLVQGFAPHLQTHDFQAFVMPAAPQGSAPPDPRALIALERGMQLLAAFLTAAGTVGLAVFYRRALLGARAPAPGVGSSSNPAAP
jgi:hypothetical protein